MPKGKTMGTKPSNIGMMVMVPQENGIRFIIDEKFIELPYKKCWGLSKEIRQTVKIMTKQ